jgi:hypothetical protein
MATGYKTLGQGNREIREQKESAVRVQMPFFAIADQTHGQET